jgi:SAM-dependent methyltransferase
MKRKQGRAATPFQQNVAAILRTLRLTRPAFRLYERYQAFEGRKTRSVGLDGMPLPPPLLRIEVVGHADPDVFELEGKEITKSMRQLLERQARPLDGMSALLDFGCGCGRVARHWQGLQNTAVHGCDYNERLIAWCRQNLPFMDARVNELEPPLPYEDHSFDFVYALSVFTHLPELLQHRWMDEMRRILKPDGVLLFTVQGEALVDALEGTDRKGLRAVFESGRLAVVDVEMAGSNRCAAYHPKEWVEKEMLRGFRVMEFVPADPVTVGMQDWYLATLKQS